MDECRDHWYSKERVSWQTEKAGEQMTVSNDGWSVGKIIGAVLLVLGGMAILAVPLAIAFFVGRKILKVQWRVGKGLLGMWLTKTQAKMAIARWAGKGLWRLMRAV